MANVKVAIRVRPLNTRESLDGGRLAVQVEDKVVRIRNVKLEGRLDGRSEGLAESREKVMEFGFDYCYWSVDPAALNYASQEEVFQDLGVCVLSGASEGYNVCLFAYGQTGSGKTYTMMGTPDSFGLTPRICQGLFRSGVESADGQSCRVEISFLEIYNERVRDLLRGTEQKKPTTLRVREHPEKGPYVQGLSQHVVTDYKQAAELLEEGIANRITAATHVHDASSRSHAIFTIQYTQAILENNLPSEIVSKINLNCQMSSSSQSINSMLSEGEGSSVGSQSSSLSGTGRRHCFIPYRDSVLTWLLKDSLGGNSRTIMIATVSPSCSSYSETLSTLRYAAHAKNIVNKPRVNEDANVRLIRELREEIDRLKSMLLSFEMVEQLTKDWSDSWRGKQALLERYSVDINHDKAGVLIHSLLPHLIALEPDVLSTGVTIYHLLEGVTRIGPKDDHCEEPHIGSCCEIENKSGEVTLKPVSGSICMLSDREIIQPCRLAQGDLVFNSTIKAGSDSRTAGAGSQESINGTAPRQRLEEQQWYIECLREEIQIEQKRAERDLEREQARLRQQHTEIQQWIFQEKQRLAAWREKGTLESGVQTDLKLPVGFSSQKTEEDGNGETSPSPLMGDRKRVVQEELLKHHAFHRAENRVRRKRLRYQLEKIARKRHLLEAKRELQRLENELLQGPDDTTSSELGQPSTFMSSLAGGSSESNENDQDQKLRKRSNTMPSRYDQGSLYSDSFSKLKCSLKATTSADTTKAKTASSRSDQDEQSLDSKTNATKKVLPIIKQKKIISQNGKGLETIRKVFSQSVGSGIRTALAKVFRKPPSGSQGNKRKSLNKAMSRLSRKSNKSKTGRAKDQACPIKSSISCEGLEEIESLRYKRSRLWHSEEVLTNTERWVAEAVGWEDLYPSSDSESIFSLDSLSSAYARALAEQLQKEECYSSDAESGGSQMSQDSLVMESSGKHMTSKPMLSFSKTSKCSKTPASDWGKQEEVKFSKVVPSEAFWSLNGNQKLIIGQSSGRGPTSKAGNTSAREIENPFALTDAWSSTDAADSPRITRASGLLLKQDPSTLSITSQDLPEKIPLENRGSLCSDSSQDESYALEEANITFFENTLLFDNQEGDDSIITNQRSFSPKNCDPACDYSSLDIVYTTDSTTGGPSPIATDASLIKSCSKGVDISGSNTSQCLSLKSTREDSDVVEEMLSSYVTNSVDSSPEPDWNLNAGHQASAHNTVRNPEVKVTAKSINNSHSNASSGHCEENHSFSKQFIDIDCVGDTKGNAPSMSQSDMNNYKVKGGEEYLGVQLESEPDVVPYGMKERFTRTLDQKQPVGLYAKREGIGKPAMEGAQDSIPKSDGGCSNECSSYGSSLIETSCSRSPACEKNTKEERKDGVRERSPFNSRYFQMNASPINAKISEVVKEHLSLREDCSGDDEIKSTTLKKLEELKSIRQRDDSQRELPKDRENFKIQNGSRSIFTSDQGLLQSNIEDLIVKKADKKEGCGDVESVLYCAIETQKADGPVLPCVKETLISVNSSSENIVVCTHLRKEYTVTSNQTTKSKLSAPEPCVQVGASTEPTSGFDKTEEVSQFQYQRKSIVKDETEDEPKCLASECYIKEGPTPITSSKLTKKATVHPRVSVGTKNMAMLKENVVEFTKLVQHKKDSIEFCNHPPEDRSLSKLAFYEFGSANLGKCTSCLLQNGNSPESLRIKINKCSEKDQVRSVENMSKSSEDLRQDSTDSDLTQGLLKNVGSGESESDLKANTQSINTKGTTASKSRLHYSHAKGSQCCDEEPMAIKDYILPKTTECEKPETIVPSTVQIHHKTNHIPHCQTIKESLNNQSTSKFRERSSASTDRNTERVKVGRKRYRRAHFVPPPSSSTDSTPDLSLDESSTSKTCVSHAKPISDQKILPSSPYKNSPLYTQSIPSPFCARSLEILSTEHPKHETPNPPTQAFQQNHDLQLGDPTDSSGYKHIISSSKDNLSDCLAPQIETVSDKRDSPMHFASSDINPFIHTRTVIGVNAAVPKKQTFGSAANVSCLQSPPSSSTKSINRCCSVDNGLNANDCPFSSHLSAYVNHKELSSTLSSNGYSRDRISSENMCKAKSYSSNMETPTAFDRTSDELCHSSAQVDEIVLVCSSDSNAQSLSMCDHGTQTTDVNKNFKGKNRHRRSSTHTPVSKDVNCAPTTWASLQNMSEHLSDLINSTSDLLGNVQYMRKGERPTIQGHPTILTGTYGDYCTKTSLDVGVQTERLSRNATAHEVNVIVKVIGSDTSKSERVCNHKAEQNSKDSIENGLIPPQQVHSFQSVPPDPSNLEASDVNTGHSYKSSPAYIGVKSSGLKGEVNQRFLRNKQVGDCLDKQVELIDRACSPILTVKAPRCTEKILLKTNQETTGHTFTEKSCSSRYTYRNENTTPRSRGSVSFESVRKCSPHLDASQDFPSFAHPSVQNENLCEFEKMVTSKCANFHSPYELRQRSDSPKPGTSGVQCVSQSIKVRPSKMETALNNQFYHQHFEGLTKSLDKTNQRTEQQQDDDAISLVPSECNTDVLINMNPLAESSPLREELWIPNNLPFHNKFTNWSGINQQTKGMPCGVKRPAEPHGTTLAHQQPLNTQRRSIYRKEPLDRRTQEIERLRNECEQVLIILQLKMSVENVNKEREPNLQKSRRARSLSPSKHQIPVHIEKKQSQRNLDLSNRRREFLQPLRQGIGETIRVPNRSKQEGECTSDIEFLLRDYNRAREEARAEIAHARDRLRERTEQEKRRLQLQAISQVLKDDLKFRTQISNSTLCSGSNLSLSSGPTSGYYSSNPTILKDIISPLIQVNGVSDFKIRTRPLVIPLQTAKAQQRWLSVQDVSLENSAARYEPVSSSSPSSPPCTRQRTLSLGCPSSILTSYQDFADCTLTSAISEVYMASGGNPRNLLTGKAEAGWRPSAHGFLGAVVLERPLESLWSIIRDHSKIHLYQELVKSAWTRPLDASTQLVYLLTDLSKCQLKQPRDFCCLSVESKQDDMLVLAMQSVFEETLPRPSVDVVRGEMLPSAWILQAHQHHGRELVTVTYMLQVDLGRPSLDPRLLNFVSRKQAAVIADLDSFLSQ
ncbi:hypothetical protein DNTS_023733 [Danionella cerebrum]|uniref:Kinesin motor domain-containing protein n=1 Tax=Danionella cerebrum TaxID=2873325 RepID=A0A553QPX5_9TELE|nr:hypothetical protein DNTS_023733 [Danionella translucida]